MQQQSPRSSVVSADEGYDAGSIASTSEQAFYRQWLSGLEDTYLGKTKHTERSHRDRQRLQSNESKSHDKLTEKDITKISSEIGKEWKSLGRELGFSEAKLRNIKDEHENNEERVHAMLIDFLRRQGKRATRQVLADALANESVGRTDIAERLVEEEEFNQNTYVLKEEGHLVLGTSPNATRFTLCRDENGQLYLMRPLTGSEFERACQTLCEEDKLAESLLRALDPIGIVSAEKERQQTEAQNRLLAEAFGRLQTLKESLDQVTSCLGNQENRGEHINVHVQMGECADMVTSLQTNCTDLLRLTGTVSHLDDPFPLKTGMYDHSIKLSACQKDLQERIKCLIEIASRNPELLDETKRLEKIHKQCQSMGKEMKMRERMCHTLLQQEFSDPERTASTPPFMSPCLSVGLPRRSSTQPLSQNELRALTEQVRPTEHNESDT